MSHQSQGQRGGLIEPVWDRNVLGGLVGDTVWLRHIPRRLPARNQQRRVEVVMRRIMRGASGRETRALHRHGPVPASNTAVGHLVLEPVI